MSDGMTDIARDQEREEAYAEYIEALAAFVVSPDNKVLKAKVQEKAKAMDEIKRGYFDGQTNITAGLNAILRDASNLKEALKQIGHSIT